MQLTLFFSQDVDEERITHSSSDNIKLTSYNDANEVADELFDSLRSRYQGNLETSMRERESNFILNLVQLLYYRCHNINFKLGGSYIYSPNWIKKKKSTKNPKNFQCFQYAVNVALN